MLALFTLSYSALSSQRATSRTKGKSEKGNIILSFGSRGSCGIAKQSEILTEYTKANGLSAMRTILESGKMDALTYSNLRLQAKYREFEVLLVPELEVLGNSPIEITHEVNFLTENGVKVISLKDGELNVETLPIIFRKGFRLVKKSIVRAY